ncbi:MAG: acyl-CoA dehydrogenase [Synergistaceae bacterium]|nr:acyl-CoA dehydrogenase [Synergistaceae bacterium]
MDFALTKEQEMVRTVMRKFALAEVQPLAAEIDEQERFPRETIEKMARCGMLGLPYPKEWGGAGGDFLSYTIAVEEISRVCAATGDIYSGHTSLCAGPIYTFGSEEQKKRYLPALLKGEKLGAFCLTEPNAGTDAAGQQTHAELHGDHWIINGSKRFITSAGETDVHIVMAMTDPSKKTRGISAFIVDRDSPGFVVGKKEHKMGIRGSTTGELIFENCRVPKENILGEPGHGFKIAMQTLDGGRIGIAAQALGLAQGALDESVKYSKERKQFGKTISEFQGLQWILADMATRIEAARHLVYNAAWRKEKGLKVTREAAMAKYFASETAMEVATKAVQIHGGYGYTREYPVERMMRDAKITEIYEGTSQVMQMVIASNLLA